MSQPPRRSLESLRSQRWLAKDDMRAFAHRQRLQQRGLDREQFLGRPVIAIINSWSDLSPCHAHLRERAASVREGIVAAGGFPVELPALSLGEVMVKPTTMLYRNFLAMETEELLRSHPVDGAVLLGGCDKTLPGMLMGALSMGLPALCCPAGPMLNDRYRGQTVGAGTHTRKFWDEYQSGNIDQKEWIRLEARMTRSPGTCNTMGTASTMAGIIEAMGFMLPGASSLPAMDAGHPRMAWACGRRIVDMVWEELTPSRCLTPAAVKNGIVACMALGGSTNAAIHIVAIAGRAGITIDLDELDAVARRIPVIANLFPNGDRLMEDFHYAGGLPALLKRLGDEVDGTTLTVTGRTLGEHIATAEVQDAAVIRALDQPVTREPALAVLRGNLCPDGAVIKASAASPKFLCHEGVAFVYDSNEAMLAAVHREDSGIDEDSVLVLRNGGPVGAPGMPEWGNLPIPKPLLARGVRDMVRISDARMSGTHYGTCVVHVTPESAVGGPLALLKTGDRIRLDVPARRLDMLVDDAELARRRETLPPRAPVFARGWQRLYTEHVLQADRGCDFDFLTGTAPTPEPPIY
ncbi:MAG: dihydroxy-acid dehydratase [Betaproteobacteria bacterium]|nr:dihydroxy-acid dehydratase [Betaproteobacteria bacterium]